MVSKKIMKWFLLMIQPIKSQQVKIYNTMSAIIIVCLPGYLKRERKKINSCTPDRDFSCFYPCELILSHTRTATWQPHVDPWHRCSVKMTSPCLILAHLGFYESLFHVFFFHNKMRYLVVSMKKNPLFVWGLDRKIKIYPSHSPFVITRQATWYKLVILGMDFSMPTSLMMGSYSLCILEAPKRILWQSMWNHLLVLYQDVSNSGSVVKNGLST